MITEYRYDIDNRALYIYHGVPGNINLLTLPNMHGPLTINFLKIYNVEHVNVQFLKENKVVAETWTKFAKQFGNIESHLVEKWFPEDES